MNRVECRYADMNGYCDSTACHNMNVVGNILPNERPENIRNSSIWAKPQSNWHTGIPTEEGWYLCAYGDNFYCANYWQGGTWENQWGGTLLAYQKIEPFKEKEK